MTEPTATVLWIVLIAGCSIAFMVGFVALVDLIIRYRRQP